MPFALITIGLIMIVAAIKNTQGKLATQLKKDFSGPGNFFYWLAGLGAIGGIGYIPALREVSRMMLALILIVMVLANGGFFAKFTAALGAIQAPPPAGFDDVGSATGERPEGENNNPTGTPPQQNGGGGAWGQIKELGGFLKQLDKATPVFPGSIQNLLKGWGLPF